MEKLIILTALLFSQHAYAVNYHFDTYEEETEYNACKLEKSSDEISIVDYEEWKAECNLRILASRNLRDAKEQAREQAREKAKEKVNQEKIRIQNAKPSPSLGMTTREVAFGTSWGRPNKINQSIGSWGTDEQWVYRGYNFLYFRNNILTSIQTSR